MKVLVKCNICDQLIAEVEKEVITEADKDELKLMCACSEHQQEDIIVEDVPEAP